MKKNLRVITPFFNLNNGDILELSEDGKYYVNTHSESSNAANDAGDSYYTSFETKFTISADYAAKLIEENYLQDVVDDQKFVNVFVEIDNLLKQYEYDLLHIDEGAENVPACVRVEKTTVLHNLIKVLTHLKNLKK